MLLAGTAAAATPPWPVPLQSKLCVQPTGPGIVDNDKPAPGVIDKHALAVVLLSPNNVSAAALSDPSVASYGPDLFVDILAQNCAGNKGCSDTDKTTLQNARGRLGPLAAGMLSPEYKATAGFDEKTYFTSRDPNNAIQCVTPPNGEQPTAPPPKVAPADQAKVKFPDLRVRGKVTDLTIPQSSAADFKGTTPATVSFSSDGVAKKSTAAMAGYVGYVVFDVNGVSPNGRTPGTEFEGILYTGVNRNVVTTGTGKTEKTTASDTVDPGALFSVTTHGDSVWNIFNVRPDLLFDVVNDSTLASVNFQWVPVVKSTLNVFHSGEAWGLPIAGKIVLDARADFGTYPDRGSAAVASTNRDYDRFGGQAGIVLVSENDNVPITLSSTYTGMYGATGGVNVGDFVNALTLYLDSDKNVGVSASYANGVREDTGKRENTWLVGLSIHY